MATNDVLSGPLGELLASMIPRVAAKTHHRYPGVPAEDMEQEMWLRALEIPDELAGYLEAEDERKVWDRLKTAAKRIGREDERFRRAQKAAAAGYSPEDEQFYSIGLLRNLLPLYVDNGVTDAPPRGRTQDGGRSKSDGSEKLGYLAMMIDLDVALKQVSGYHRSLLKSYFALPQGEGGDDVWKRQQMASSMGMTYDALRMRVARALVSLQEELGGASPWPRRQSSR